MVPKAGFDVDVAYLTDKTPLTVTIPVNASEQDIAEIESAMIQAFAKTEGVSESVMRSLLQQSRRQTKSATHTYIQWTRVHAKPDEMYPNRLMENIRAVRKN